MYGLAVLIGLLYFLFLSLMTYSMKYISAAVSAVIIYLAIPISYIFDIFIYETHIGKVEALGAIIIVLTNMIIGVIKGR